MIATEGSVELAMLNSANIGLGLFKQFAKVESGGQIHLGAGTRFIHFLPELYIYSFAQGELETLTDEMCVRSPVPYDACLRLVAPLELGRVCFQQGTISNLGGRYVREFFKEIVIGTVEYVQRSIDVTEGEALAPDPFKKAERFSRQSEARLVFVPHEGVSIEEQRLIMAIPNPSSHFECVFRNRLLL